MINIHDFEFDFANPIYATVENLKLKKDLNRITIQRNLSMLHINIRSLAKNYDKLHQFICNLPFQPGIIAITETKLNINSNTNNIQLDNYKLIHKDSMSRAGGVAMYISNHLNFTINTDIELYDKTTESLWININKNDVVKW